MDGFTQGIVPSLPLAASLPAGLLAYIDPGTGSLVFQVLIAGLLTAGWMLRQLPLAIGRRLGRLLGRGRTEPPAATELLKIERHPSAAGRHDQSNRQSPRPSKAA